MKVAVAIKQVPARDSQLRVDAGGRWIDESALSFEINEPDAYALEAALQVKEAEGGEVVVVSAGPDRVSSAIREALAKGADRAIHVHADNLESYDTLNVAGLLAKAIAAEQPDLVLTGLQSDDLGNGQTGVILAELLGLPHATIIMNVAVAGGRVKVKRELEDGWFQQVEMPLPAVLTIQSGSYKLRYATLIGIKKARTKEVKQVSAAELGAGAAGPRVELARLYAPQKARQTEMLEGDAADVAARLVEKLKHEVRVL
jgi:electron transfer flavoprotein beta subunit